MINMEHIILYNLCNNSEYTQKVNVHLKSSFFDSFYNREIYFFVDEYISKFKDVPTKSILQHEISKSSKYNETQFKEIIEELDEVFTHDEKQNLDWLVDETEKHCQNIAFESALINGFAMYQENKKDKDKALELMRDALRVEFDSDTGIDFFDESSIDKRYEEYNKDLAIHKTGSEHFDIVCGGLKSKAVSVIMAPSGTGKTLAMISLITDAIRNGHNVCYFTMEMSEEEISKRVEANLLNIEINDIKNTDKKLFKSSLLKLKEMSYGTLKIKEFPTGSANVNHFDKQLDEWKIKDNFVADIIVADYLSIMSSVRIKDANSYTIVKSITEEFRGLCVKRNAAGLSAIQTNREGMNSSNLNYTNVSDSIGVVFTADLIIGIISSEEMRKEGYQIWKLLKNRNTGITDYFFPVLTEFEFSRLKDASADSFSNQLLLNNNPDTIMRIEKMKKNEGKFISRKFDSDVKLIKKKENNFKFETEEEFDFMVE